MPGFSQTPKFLLRFMHLPPRLAYAIGLGPLFGRLILLLTTTGRKSGKLRVTPLQYEEIDGRIYLGAALGKKADWIRNIQANPRVMLQVKSRRFTGMAEIISAPMEIADFLEIRYQHHPRMIGAMLRGEGLSIPPQRAELESYAVQLTVVRITEEIKQD
jgi:deazaflavin-dependent oxidoreductase (nitroreductase family)